MPPIISYLERQKMESSPTQTTGTHSLHPCVSIAFKSSQPPSVPSLTPPPPRHYLRNATSNEKLQGLIQKRSDIYTRAQQAQQEEFDCSRPCAQPPAHPEPKVHPVMLTRSSSFAFETSVNPWGTQVTRSASWKAMGIAPSCPSNESPTEIRVVEFESLGAQRRENMVLGLSEVDAHLKGGFDSETGASVATHSFAHYAPFHLNRSEVEYKDVLGFTAATEQIPVNHQIRVDVPATDTQGPNHDFPKSYQDAVDLNDDRTSASHHTHSSTPHGFPFPQRQRQRARTLQRARRPKGSFPPPREFSLVDHPLWPDPHASRSIAAHVGNPPHPHPVGFPADSENPRTRNQEAGHKASHSKSGCSKAVSKALRHLGDGFRSDAYPGARGRSGIVEPSK